jgi:hypothetical protein
MPVVTSNIQKFVNQFYTESLPEFTALTGYDETKGIWTPRKFRGQKKRELKMKLCTFEKCYESISTINFNIAPFREPHENDKKENTQVKKPNGDDIDLKTVYLASSYCLQKLQMQYITPINMELSERKSRCLFLLGLLGGFILSVLASIIVSVCFQS